MIVLIGPPGAGKTTAGALLARRLDLAFRDTDADVEAVAGKPVADVFVEDGEDAFRQLERQVTIKALTEHDGVLAVGSGAVLDPDVRAALDPATVVYLKADFAAVAKHAGLDKPRIVLPGNPRGRLRAMLEERGPLYEGLATVTVDTADADAQELADRIATELQR
ncbi:MAG TPA: shikimate kinase [Streptosporangiaceae bacterium]|jgi:shikimate kinase|nr:shikimate kinase [Streptosporangiaceae bacterium]